MSDAIFTLDASIRTDLGKGASRRLRHQDKVPAILYGGEDAPVSITLDHNKVLQAQEFEAFYSHVLTINVEGKKVEALVKDMQRHPYKPKVMHIDFKTEGGHAEHHMADIEITCMPKDLPEFIEVDLMDVALGQTLHISDIKLPKGVESVELTKGESHDLAVVTVKTAKGPAVEDEDSAAEGDAEATEE